MLYAITTHFYDISDGWACHLHLHLCSDFLFLRWKKFLLSQQSDFYGFEMKKGYESDLKSSFSRKCNCAFVQKMSSCSNICLCLFVKIFHLDFARCTAMPLDRQEISTTCLSVPCAFHTEPSNIWFTRNFILQVTYFEPYTNCRSRGYVDQGLRETNTALIPGVKEARSLVGRRTRIRMFSFQSRSSAVCI
jgi:hypothetical protein